MAGRVHCPKALAPIPGHRPAPSRGSPPGADSSLGHPRRTAGAASGRAKRDPPGSGSLRAEVSGRRDQPSCRRYTRSCACACRRRRRGRAGCSDSSDGWSSSSTTARCARNPDPWRRCHRRQPLAYSLLSRKIRHIRAPRKYRPPIGDLPTIPESAPLPPIVRSPPRSEGSSGGAGNCCSPSGRGCAAPVAGARRCPPPRPQAPARSR